MTSNLDSQHATRTCGTLGITIIALAVIAFTVVVGSDVALDDSAPQRPEMSVLMYG